MGSIRGRHRAREPSCLVQRRPQKDCQGDYGFDKGTCNGPERRSYQTQWGDSWHSRESQSRYPLIPENEDVVHENIGEVSADEQRP